MDDESGESMEPIEEVPLVELGESELERLVRGWRREAGSWFQRRGEAYRTERSVIRREDDGYGLLLYKRFFITHASKNFKMQKNVIFFFKRNNIFLRTWLLKMELFRIAGTGFYRPDAQLSLKRDTSYWLSTDQYTRDTFLQTAGDWYNCRTCVASTGKNDVCEPAANWSGDNDMVVWCAWSLEEGWHLWATIITWGPIFKTS